MNRGNVAWSGFEAGASALLSFIASFAIARLVGPAELGVGAAAVSVHVLLWVGVNALFADALVQRESVDDTLVASAFWTAAAVGGAAMLVQAGAGWVLARAMGDHRLVGMGLLLAVPLPLVGMGGVMQGLLTRRRSYRLLAMRTLCGQGLGTLTGVGLALAGCGGWALVGQQAVVSLVGAGALLVGAGLRPQRVWHGPAVHDLLRLGLPLTASTLVMIARYRLFAVLIGSVAGPAALGEVHVAFRLVDTLRELIFTALWRLMLPVLSERQHDLPGLRREMDRLLRLSSLVVLPLCAAMAALLPPVVAVLLGPKWSPAGRAALPLIGLMAVLTLLFPAGVALVAVGRPRVALAANIAGLLASAAGVLLLRPASPWHAVLVWCASQVFVTPYALWMTARVLAVNLLRPVRAGLPALAASLAVLLAVRIAVPGPGPAWTVLLWRGSLLIGCGAAAATAWLIRAAVAPVPAAAEPPPVDHPSSGS
jgi:O-antigen/teichoic acid export membrane protein